MPELSTRAAGRHVISLDPPDDIAAGHIEDL